MRRAVGRVGIALVSVLAAGALVAVPASAGPAATTRLIPGWKAVEGSYSVLCPRSYGFDCTGDGYNGTAGQFGTNGWTSWQFWSSGTGGTSVKHNCTTYAAYRLMRNGVPFPGWTLGDGRGNANKWDTLAHPALVNQTPAVGSIAQWNGGRFGHVGYVEAVTPTYIDVSSDNADVNYTIRHRIMRSSAYMPDNFIHYTLSRSWVNHSGAAKRVALTRGPSAGYPWVAFHVGLNSVIFRKRAGDAGWTAMSQTQAKDVAAMTNADGRVEVFQIGLNGRIYHSWQSVPNGSYAGWVDRGGNWLSLAATRGPSGGWQLFAVGTDRRLYRLAPWDGVPSWTAMPTAELNRVSAMTNPDGRLELLVTNIHGTTYQAWQSVARGAFGSWVQVPGVPGGAREVAFVPRVGGGWEQYATTGGRKLYVRSSADGAWRPFLGVTADLVVASQNADGREEVWHVNTSNGAMWHAWQQVPGTW